MTTTSDARLLTGRLIQLARASTDGESASKRRLLTFLDSADADADDLPEGEGATFRAILDRARCLLRLAERGGVNEKKAVAAQFLRGFAQPAPYVRPAYREVVPLPWPVVYALDWDGVRLIEVRWRGRWLHGAFGQVSVGAALVVFEPEKVDRSTCRLGRSGYRNVSFRPMPKGEK